MSNKKGQKYNIEPKLEHKEVFDKVVKDSKSMGQAITEVYGSKYNPTVLKKTKGFQKLLSTIKDEKILLRWEDWALNEEKDRRLAFDAGKEIMKINNRYPKEGNQTNIQVNVNKFKEYE